MRSDAGIKSEKTMGPTHTFYRTPPAWDRHKGETGQKAYMGDWGCCLQIIQTLALQTKKHYEKSKEVMPRGARLDAPGNLHHVGMGRGG